MLDECLDCGRASEAHGMMKRGNAILVGGVDFRTGSQQLFESSPLISGIRIALATDLEEFVLHLHLLWLQSSRIGFLKEAMGRLLAPTIAYPLPQDK